MDAGGRFGQTVAGGSADPQVIEAEAQVISKVEQVSGGRTRPEPAKDEQVTREGQLDQEGW
jgi:hypothetical protein